MIFEMWTTTATRSAQVPRSSSASAFSKKGASKSSISQRQHFSSSHLPWDGRPMTRGMETMIPHASFFQTLFSGGGSQTKTNEVEELLSELTELIKKRSNKAMIGPNERIESIVDELARYKIPRNPVRSPLLPGTYAVRYVTQLVFPPFSTNQTFTISDSLDIFEQVEIKDFGVFPGYLSRSGTARVFSSDTLAIQIDKKESKRLFGSKTEPESRESRFQIFYLDDRLLAVRRNNVDIEGKQIRPFDIKIIFERLLSEEEEEEETIEEEDQGVRSSISIGGLPGLKRKEGAATQAERSYQNKTGPSAKIASARTNVAERDAREEALRQQKEKATAAKEAALALKAEIKSSVEGFNQRVKEAQEGKKEAMAALREFERENGDALKEVVAFRETMESMDNQIARLTEEVFNMTAEEKQYAQEIKECRRELTLLERKLAVF